MGVGSVSKQETIPQMFKVYETTTITFHILDDAIKSLHRPIRESASVGAVSTHSFDHNERACIRAYGYPHKTPDEVCRKEDQSSSAQIDSSE